MARKMQNFRLKMLFLLGFLSVEAMNIVKFPEDVETIRNSQNVIKILEEKGANPIVLLIEDQPESFISANRFVDSISSDKLNFWIISFNATGASHVLEFSNKHFRKTLNELTSASYLNENSSNKSLVFFGTLHAAQIVPRNSTIVVFSEGKNVDENLAQQAFNAVFTKNITVHLYWSDSNSSPNNFLKEISRLSGGEIFTLPYSKANFENYTNVAYENSLSGRISILLTRRNQRGLNILRFPVDSDVIGIYVSIVPWDDTNIILTTPTGKHERKKICPLDSEVVELKYHGDTALCHISRNVHDLLPVYKLVSPRYVMTFSDDISVNSARKYSYGSFFERQGEFLDIHLNFLNSPRPSVGFWNVTVENLKKTYNVTVYGLTNITAHAFVQVSNKENTLSNDEPKELIKIGVSGDVNNISDINFLKSDGYSIIENFIPKPTSENNWEKLSLKSSDDDFKELDVEIDNKSNSKPSYALVRGLDIKGNVFERLGYIFGFNKRNLYPQETLTVDVGVGSQLLIVPGEQAHIYFEVTNRGNDIINTFFSVSDTRWILQSLSAYRRVLNPQESYIVTLTITRQARSGSYQDEITFKAKGGGQIVQKKALIDVGSTQNYYDRSEPSLDYSYTSDCTEVIFKRCEQGTWTIEVSAQDTDSGILQVNSVPKGLYFPTSYTAGTLERVVGYYSDSCCNPDLQIVAVDRANNRRSYNVNAYHAIWSPGAIAALVLGILLFILLVALTVYLICRCRRRKETFDLPTYRGGDI